MSIMTTELILGICLGLGLAAACGFRVFVPLFLMSLSARAGYLELADSFAWIDSWAALVMFGVATLIEVGAYYIPWVDNLLDAVATPAAVIAGTIATAASVTDVSPLIQWSAAIIGGASVAGVVQTSSVLLRSTSSVTTAGLGNAAVSTIEWIGSAVMSLVAIILPVVAGLIVVSLTAAAIIFLTRRRRPRSTVPRDSAIHS